MARLAFILLALSGLINLFFGLAVLARTYQRAYGWYFSLTILGIVLWVIGDLGLLFATDPDAVRVYAQFFYIAPMVTPIFMWFFAMSFPENRRLPLAPQIMGVVAFGLFAGLFLWKFDFFVKDITIASPLNIATPNSPGFLFYSAYFSVFFILAYIAFVVKMRKLRGLRKTQVSYTFWGVLIGSCLALISNLSLPTMGVRHLIWMGPIFTLFFTAVVTTAIIRHRLFNIRLVLARSIGYLLSLTSLALLYGFVGFFVVNLVSGESVNPKQQLVYAVLAAGLAFTFYPVRRFFEKVTNRVFYRDAYDPQELFNTFNQVLVENAQVERLMQAASKTVADNLKAEFCLVAISGARTHESRTVGTVDKTFTEEDISNGRRIFEHIQMPVVVSDYLEETHHELKNVLLKKNISVMAQLYQQGREPLGYLMLGPKKSGNPYTSQDVSLIEALANELVIAIQNALRFEEIERFNITLQQKVDDATRKLRNTNDKLRAMDETKDEFISMASHQLRTPLTAVKGYLSMVLEGDAGQLNDMQRKLLSQAFTSSQRMVFLIADLLNVSRLRTGKFIIETMPSNLAEVIEGEVNQLRETAEGRGLQLTFEKPAHFPTVVVDETKIRQVIMNFIDNAIYYTPPGGHIKVQLKETDQAIEFTVTDDGIGVPKHEQHHLFNKFYRAGNARKARPDGTGLGLFMAKKVVIAQGGTILFKSKEDKGSTFGFSFAKSKVLAPPHAVPVAHGSVMDAAEESLTN